MGRALWRRTNSAERRRTARASADDAGALTSGRRCHEIADDVAFGGRRFVPEDSGSVGHDGFNDCALEEPVSEASHRRSDGGTTSRPAAIRKNTETAGQGTGRDPGGTKGRFDSLGVPQTGKPLPGG